MANDSSVVCWFTFTSSALLRNQLKLSKTNHHETEAEVQATHTLNHTKDNPQKYSKQTEYVKFKFSSFFFFPFEPGQSSMESVASWSREAAKDINIRYKTDPPGSLVSECHS